jgi:hypothetical protein
MEQQCTLQGNRAVRLLIGQFQRHQHLALFGEFEGVAHQVDQNLAQPGHIADDAGGYIRGNMVSQFDLFFGRLRRKEIDSLLDARDQAELLEFQLQIAGLDLREVENVVDDREQRVAALADDSR